MTQSCRIWGGMVIHLLLDRSDSLCKLRHLLVKAQRLVTVSNRVLALQLADLRLLSALLLFLRLQLLCSSPLRPVEAAALAPRALSRLSLLGRARVCPFLIPLMGGDNLLRPTCVLQRG